MVFVYPDGTITVKRPDGIHLKSKENWDVLTDVLSAIYQKGSKRFSKLNESIEVQVWIFPTKINEYELNRNCQLLSFVFIRYWNLSKKCNNFLHTTMTLNHERSRTDSTDAKDDKYVFDCRLGLKRKTIFILLKNNILK